MFDTGPDHRATVRILEARIVTLETALRWFLDDQRFQVAVGGNPNAVHRMLADARHALDDTRCTDCGNAIADEDDVVEYTDGSRAHGACHDSVVEAQALK